MRSLRSIKGFTAMALSFCLSMICLNPCGFAGGNSFPGNIPEWPVRSADVSGTLLFSDSPELVERDGILYADTVQGPARLLYYHLNATTHAKKLAVIVENDSKEDANVTIKKYALGGPNKDFLVVGKQTQTEYFSRTNMAFAHVPAQGKKLLLQQFQQMLISPGELVYGVIDFESRIPVKVSVVMLPDYQDPLKFLDRAKVLPADQHRLRGTFAGMDRVMRADKPYDGRVDGTVGVTLADGKLDPYRMGIDATDGSIVENYGNYGVLYKIELPLVSGGKTKYLLNPRGGVYAGMMRVQNGKFGVPNTIETPSGKPFLGHRGANEAAELGTYRNHSSILFEFSPPGASNLPVRLILSPAD